jgi:phage tail-like protein
MGRMNASTNRFDPYRNFRFKVKWDGQYVAGLTKMGALRRTTEMVEFREAGENITSRKLPGKTSYQAVTMEAGVTYDTSFEDWANLVNDFASHSVTSLGSFRKNVTVDVFNEAGQKVISYNLYRAWISEYQALPDLDAGANAVAITTIKIEYEWFERDPSVSEATCPRLTTLPRTGRSTCQGGCSAPTGGSGGRPSSGPSPAGRRSGWPSTRRFPARGPSRGCSPRVSCGLTTCPPAPTWPGACSSATAITS